MSRLGSARALSVGVALAVVALASFGVHAHTTARGAVLLRLDDSGRIDVRLEITELEALDLFDVDAQSKSDEPRLAGVLEAKLPRYWQFSADDGVACAHQFKSWSRRGVRTLVIESEVRCPTLPTSLTIDWGLSAISTLDLVAVTTLEAPGGIRHTTIFSRQTPKETFVVRHPSALTTFGRFVMLGVEHIATGFDHLAFLLALLLGCATLRRVVVVVTAFTLAHSVTLALGATGLVHLPSALVESIIAVSISVAALTVFFRIRRGQGGTPGSVSPDGGRVSIEAVFALCFGLIHGLGFASMLEEALGQEPRILLALFGFNLGVEFGQLVAVAIAFPLALAVAKRPFARVVFMTIAVVIAALGVVWTVERVLG
jgi:hypothetical protein